MDATAPGVRACFDALVDLPLSERSAWLDAHAVDGPTREQVLALLAADARDDEPSPLLSIGAAVLAAEFTPEPDDGAGLIGTSIGPYTLTGILGQGGTSVVFRAERPMGEGTQVVALKMLRTGLFSADSQRRFRREQGVLSHLSHPNIAGLVDGGIGTGGIPYIAMEFVDGQTITDYAAANALDVPARLQLMMTVCRAVDGAHRALVVHKDLKPSNVLVRRDGVAKVLDFGIAQLLDDGSGKNAQTQVIALTPGYAAPEQYQPGPVTTATDIFALGVLLGELLTGRPVAPHRASSLSRTVDDGTHDPSHGLPSAASLRRLLRGDLDAIYGTACSPEPERRYGSAALLADDIERYLNDLPVKARAPSLLYRVRKYVQRNRIIAAASALILLAVVTGVSTTLWQARVAREEGRRATAVSNFLVGLFEASKSGQLPERRLTLEELVHRASERLQQETDLSASARVDMMCMLAEVGMAASDFPAADHLLQRALELGASTFSPGDPALLRIRLLRANLLILQTRYADAATAYEAVLPQIAGAADAASIRALRNYAVSLMYSARTEPALKYSAQAARAASAFYGRDSQEATLAALDHGVLLFGAGNSARARDVLEPALERWRGARWAPTREYLRALKNTAQLRAALGDLAAAERDARDVVATSELIYESPHEQIGWALVNLADVIEQQERLDEAEPMLLRALAMFRAIYGEGQMRDANALASIGRLQWRRRDFADAQQSIRQAQQWCAKPGLHATRTCLGLDAVQTRIALSLGDVAQADVSSARGLAMAREIYRDGSGATAELLQLRAGVQLRNGDALAALASCDEARTMLTLAGETRTSTFAETSARRADVLESLRRPAAAIADVQAALALSRQLAPEGYRSRAAMLAQLARLQAATGEADAAVETARSALESIGQRGGVDPAVLEELQSRAVLKVH